jgi:hypothetical protein
MEDGDSRVPGRDRGGCREEGGGSRLLLCLRCARRGGRHVTRTAPPFGDASGVYIEATFTTSNLYITLYNSLPYYCVRRTHIRSPRNSVPAIKNDYSG